jgi:hypothetical protein
LIGEPQTFHSRSVICLHFPLLFYQQKSDLSTSLAVYNLISKAQKNLSVFIEPIHSGVAGNSCVRIKNSYILDCCIWSQQVLVVDLRSMGR